jgi:hypothetical protein
MSVLEKESCTHQQFGLDHHTGPNDGWLSGEIGAPRAEDQLVRPQLLVDKPACAVRTGQEQLAGADARGLPLAGHGLMIHLPPAWELRSHADGDHETARGLAFPTAPDGPFSSWDSHLDCHRATFLFLDSSTRSTRIRTMRGARVRPAVMLKPAVRVLALTTSCHSSAFEAVQWVDPTLRRSRYGPDRTNHGADRGMEAN